MPPAYVKPYVKRQKNDAADAEAICEAVTRANMRFVPTKTPEQQSCLMLHRTRHLFIRQQTAVINAIRAHLAEFGIVAPVGRNGVEELLNVVADQRDDRIPEVARACLEALGALLGSSKHRSWSSTARSTPGIAPTKPAAARRNTWCRSCTGNRSGRQRRRSEGVPIRPGLLSLGRSRAEATLQRWQGQARQHHQARRSLSAQPVCAGALAVIRYAKIHGTTHRPWLKLAGAPADEGRSDRARQQDRSHGVGHDGQG